MALQPEWTPKGQRLPQIQSTRAVDWAGYPITKSHHHLAIAATDEHSRPATQAGDAATLLALEAQLWDDGARPGLGNSSTQQENHCSQANEQRPRSPALRHKRFHR